MIGKTLGHYQITGELGKGGMGEVYRAHDARLDRDVAVKVLPARLSENAEIRARFEREAKTVSSLNHPHICVLHDVGREGDVDYLVMELVEGETLADRLTKGALPPSELLRIGVQIADALDRAHQAGVVHRDLKPGNIMLTRSGAKLMDFGLARATGLGGPIENSGLTVAQMTHSPTVGQPLTAEGTIIGTFQYMAPEQLEGREADERADLWALGCVLYEMATGQPAFAGTSQASLIAGIIHTEPQPVSQVAPLSPPGLDRLIGACLTKDPAERVQSAHDMKLQLSWMAEGGTSVSGVAAPVAPASRGGSRWLPFALIVLATAIATALVTTFLTRGDAQDSPVSKPQRYILGMADLRISSAPEFAPDGSHVVISVREGPTQRLYRRTLGSIELVPIEGTEEGYAPFYSPDGTWIGFCTSDAIRKVPAGGGVAQLIASYPRPSAGAWSEDGTIYFSVRSGGLDGTIALAKVSSTGGPVEVAAVLDSTAGAVESWLPEVLPDGETILHSTFTATGQGIVARRADGSEHTVVENAFLARYAEPGYLFYRDADSRAVLAAPFDPAAVRITGPAIPLTEEVDASFCYDVSHDGKLVYVPLRGVDQGQEIIWLDRNGASSRVTETRADWTQPRISPDGSRLVVRKIETDCELWLLDLERETFGRIAQESDNHDPIWSPDGTRIAYERSTARELVTLTVDGSRQTTVLASGTEAGPPHSWSGELLAYVRTAPGTGSDIWLLRTDGSTPPESYLATESEEDYPAISPDGTWIAYQSDETGTTEIFVRAYPDNGTSWQVSSEGGSGPTWSHDGSELFYVADTKLMSVSIETDPALRVGTPQELFDGGVSTTRARDYDVAPDGRFVTVRRTGGEGAGDQIRLLIDWPGEMARMAGGR